MSPAPAAAAAARAAQRTIASAEVAAAEALVTIERSRAHVLAGFASVHAWAASVGYGPQQAGRLLALGRALREAPELVSVVRSGSVCAESAIAVGRVLLEPALPLTAEDRDAWVRKARTDPPRTVRRDAERAIQDARQGEPTLAMRFHVTLDTRDAFRRARLLMSRGEPRQITEGETLGRLASTWLDTNDPTRAPLPERRSGPTRSRRGRYIPRRVRAVVERRSGGRCEICRVRRAAEKIHIQEAHVDGGSREADNIADACRECHVLVDAKVFRFSHFDEDQRPRWTFLGSRVRERAPCYAATAPAPFG